MHDALTCKFEFTVGKQRPNNGFSSSLTTQAIEADGKYRTRAENPSEAAPFAREDSAKKVDVIGRGARKRFAWWTQQWDPHSTTDPVRVHFRKSSRIGSHSPLS